VLYNGTVILCVIRFVANGHGGALVVSTVSW
jgi:hypothetical protein